MEPILFVYDHIISKLRISAKWRDSFKWAATILITIAAMMVSFSIELSELVLPFIGFFLGHILWSLSAAAMKEYSLLTLNLGFIPIDIYAIYIRVYS